MSEQTTSEKREEEIRARVISWLKESFEGGDYRLINTGGATPSRDYFLQVRNRTPYDLRELRVGMEIYKDQELVDKVTARTKADGIKAGEEGQLGFFTKHTNFSALKMLPDTVTYKTDWVPDKVMETEEHGKALKKKKKKKVSEAFRTETGDILRDKKGEYVKQLAALSEKSNDEEIKGKISALIPVMEKVYARAAEVPGSETEVKRLTDRYLPMVINSTSSYTSYAAKGIDGEDMEELREEVIKGLDLVTEACDTLLKRLYEDGIVDASTDISVLEMLLKQDGLLGSDFKK